MTYQDYFRNSDFEDIWTVLNGFYMEDEGLKPQYSSLVDEIRKLPLDSEHSEVPIQMRLDSENEIVVLGAPDPQEWLLGREVEVDFSSWKDKIEDSEVETASGFKTFDMLSPAEKRQLARDSDTATLTAHLLYWSTLYAIKTQEQHEKGFSEWLESLENGTTKYEMEPEYEADSRCRKQRKYWRETVARDSPFDWCWNLVILKKKLEFNIGFWRYVQRHVGWEEDVKRMKIAANLIDIAKNDWPDVKGKHINLRTAQRYTHEQDHGGDLHELYLAKLYRDKSFHILWKWLDHNMKKWWD